MEKLDFGGVPQLTIPPMPQAHAESDTTPLIALIWSMSKAELNELSKIMRARRSQLTAQEIFNWHTGDKVQFTSKRGQLITGTVEKTNRTSVSVTTERGTWRVSPGLLTKINVEAKK